MADTLDPTSPRPGRSATSVTTLPSGAPDTIHRTRRQRRPTGAPPPLPRKLGTSGTVWLGMLAWVGIATLLLLRVDAVLHLSDRVDSWWLRLLAGVRAGWLTALMRGIKVGLSGWAITILGLGLVVVLMIFRRWRHLLVFLVSTFVLRVVGAIVYDALTRPRPYGVRIISGWGGFAIPSAPVGVLAAILVGITYTLIVPGRPRFYAKVGIGAVMLVLILAREYLGMDGPSDAFSGMILGIAVPLTAFRLFTPNEVFPVVYRKGSTAHLDVSGGRGEAIREAVRDQLGLVVVEIKPVGLEGSGGSTPLRLKVEGDPDRFLFAKLYAKSHVRADRWYKLWRTILYGSLEDEASFQTVRRFVEYEDYTLRLMKDVGIPVPIPYGIVEITPEREYMIVMEFFEGAQEIGEAAVDEGIIDDALILIRKLWDSGMAHRDIKPANLMVRDGKVLLIDVFFVQVKPSPWRQAVDLGNMMLVLAVRSHPEVVYEHALKFFTPDEIAEAFAATRGVASPTQLRSFMKRDPRDLLGKFRSLAPKRRPIAIQRWSVRRVALAMGMLLGFALGIGNGIGVFTPVQNLEIPDPPECGPNHAMILAAQAVPSAARIPCLASLPSGWTYGGGNIHSGQAQFWLNSDQAGVQAVTVALTSFCDVSGDQQVPSDEEGTRRFEKPASLTPRLVDRRSYLFPGGCATYQIDFAPGAPTTLVFDVDGALSFLSRDEVVTHVEQAEHLTLCGRGAPCPG